MFENKRVIVIVLLIYLSLGFYKPLYSQQQKIDSLRTKLNAAKEDTNKVKILNELGLRLFTISDYEQALQIVIRAKELAYNLRFKKGEARAYNTVGMIHIDQGDYPQALRNTISALNIWESMDSKKGIAYSYNNIGIIYKLQGNYEESLKNYYLSLAINKEIGTKNSIAGCYNNIGNVLVLQASDSYDAGNIQKSDSEYVLALENFSLALELSKETGEKESIANAYNNTGLIYSQRGNFTLDTGNKKETNDKFNQALKNFLAALKLYEEIGNVDGIIACYTNIGTVYYNSRDYPEAEKNCRKALEMARKVGATERIKTVCSILTEVLYDSGNVKEAFKIYKEYIASRDTLLSEENTKQIVQIQMQHEFDKKLATDSIRNAEQVKQNTIKHEQEIQQQRIYAYGGVIGFLLMIIVAIVSFRAYRQKQKANEIISEQKLIVEGKQKEIIDSIHYAKRIQQSLLTKEKYIEKSISRLKQN